MAEEQEKSELEKNVEAEDEETFLASFKQPVEEEPEPVEAVEEVPLSLKRLI